MKPVTEVLFYLNAFKTARLSHNGYGWILEQVIPNSEVEGSDIGFRAIAVVQSRKDLLLNSIRKHSVLTDPIGRRMLAALEDDYWYFYADLAHSGIDDKIHRLRHAAESIPPLAERLVMDDSARRKRVSLWREERPTRTSQGKRSGSK